mgnify:CR=1 FL=1
MTVYVIQGKWRVVRCNSCKISRDGGMDVAHAAARQSAAQAGWKMVYSLEGEVLDICPRCVEALESVPAASGSAA